MTQATCPFILISLPQLGPRPEPRPTTLSRAGFRVIRPWEHRLEMRSSCHGNMIFKRQKIDLNTSEVASLFLRLDRVEHPRPEVLAAQQFSWSSSEQNHIHVCKVDGTTRNTSIGTSLTFGLRDTNIPWTGACSLQLYRRMKTKFDSSL
jgi:hypothetical protein